jgi:hypothetical protein
VGLSGRVAWGAGMLGSQRDARAALSSKPYAMVGPNTAVGGWPMSRTQRLTLLQSSSPQEALRQALESFYQRGRARNLSSTFCPRKCWTDSLTRSWNW